METWNADIVSSLYQSLEGEMPIRLLRLHPGKRGDSLSADIISTSVAEADSQYEATSYTWGSPIDPQCMTCNGLNVVIQRNAFEMLNDLRLPDQPRTVWIDAICIDQSNIEERAWQVSFMHYIYRRAKRVLVWLGKPDVYSFRAMAYAAELNVAKILDESRDNSGFATLSWDIYIRKSYFFEPEDGAEESSQHQTLGIALVKFINRPWFNRVWIQQEAALCRDTQMICGPQEVGWDNIYALAWMLLPRSIGLHPDYISEDLNGTLNNISAVENIQRRRKRQFGDFYRTRGTLIYLPLITSLIFSSRYGATDPRDKLYSLQYFAEDASEWFEVDYSIPWQILYIDVARRFLQQGILGFLKNAGRARQKPDGVLPSWAPDFRDGNWGSNMMAEHPSWMAGGPKTDTASATLAKSAGNLHTLPKRHRRRLDLPKEFKNFKGPRKALLQSYASFKCTMSDEIVYIADVLDDPFDIETTLKILGKDLDYIGKLEPQTYLNNESLQDAYKLTLILSSNRDQDIVDSGYVRGNWDDWIQWLEDPRRGREDMPVWEYSMEAAGALQSFRFAITKHGYFCLVPRAAQLHDVVCIFVGYLLGVVIRPWQPPSSRMSDRKAGERPADGAEETEYFELIGDSYIHGMMRNEARCIIVEFGCKHNPTQTQLGKMAEASDSGRGVSWKTLGLHGGYERVFSTLGDHLVKLV
ncbi:hypothetical protein AAE478_005746 [Parahypoxylon ruwenzoriense]